MKGFDRMSYTDKIKWRIRLLWGVLLLMLVYMVVIGELGGGDSRIMTRLANTASRLIFFGGMAWVIACIVHNRRLLRDRQLLQAQRLKEQDERRQYLHDKSGGAVMDIFLIVLLFATTTTAMFSMPAFYVCYALLWTAIILKGAAYLIYAKWT